MSSQSRKVSPRASPRLRYPMQLDYTSERKRQSLLIKGGPIYDEVAAFWIQI